MKNPVAYILIGLPGCGKTSWINDQEWFTSRYKLLSRDNYLREVSNHKNISLTEAVNDYQGDCSSEILLDAVNISNRKQHVIIDDYNITQSHREKLLFIFSDYKKIAICFRERDVYLLHERVKHRVGYVISMRRLQLMNQMYVYPSETEGFDDIWYTN